MQRGRRTFGLTIALAACTFLFGLYPLALAIFFLQFGAQRGSGPDPRVLLELVLSLGFLALMVPAWIGRPPRIRVVLSVAVVLLLVLKLGFNVADLVNAQGTLDSSAALVQNALLCEFPLYVLLTLYIVWYLNRYPARQFYGGPGGDSGDGSGGTQS